MSRPASAHWNPYIAGLALGAVLTLSFVMSGRGLGVSGVFSDMTRSFLSPASVPPVITDPLLYEVLGLIFGAWLSARLARRPWTAVARGPRTTDAVRIFWAVAGGAAVGFGSRLAHGCTSGQALSGGALLSLGSWVFMISLFAAAYALSAAFRRTWT